MRARLARTKKLYNGLHPITKEALSKVTQTPEKSARETVKRLNFFNSSPSRKSLEKLVYSVHFHQLNEAPKHVQTLRKNPFVLGKFWPFEYEHEVTSMTDPKKQSLTIQWQNNDSNALKSTKFERHNWLKAQSPDQQMVKELTGVDSLTLTGGIEKLALSPDEINKTLRKVFEQYFFLKTNPKLCPSKKLPVPIVEVGMKPDGFDIADVRIDNLFKKKVTQVTTVLETTCPVLNDKAESILWQILTDDVLNRPTRRMYRSLCSKAYTRVGDNYKISKVARYGFLYNDELEPLESLEEQEEPENADEVQNPQDSAMQHLNKVD